MPGGRGVVAGLNSSLRVNSLFKFAMRQNSTGDHQMTAVTLLEELQVKLLFFLRGTVIITWHRLLRFRTVA
jgi:RNA-binding protein YhbY